MAEPLINLEEPPGDSVELGSAKLAEVEKFMHDPAGWSKAHGGVSAAAAE